MPGIYQKGQASVGGGSPRNVQYVDRKGNYNLPAYRNRFIAAMDPAERVAMETEADYLGRARTYDPTAALRTSTQAAWGDVREDLGRTLEDFQGAAVGAGRLDTGFYDEDRGRIITDVGEDFANQAGRMALDAEGLRLRNQEDLGQYAGMASNRYLDIVTGGLDRAEAEAEAKRRRGGGLGRFLGTVAGGVGGFLVGGPAGAAAGAGAANRTFS